MPLILTVTKSPEGYSHVSRVNGVDDGTPTSDRARGGPLEAPSDGQVHLLLPTPVRHRPGPVAGNGTPPCDSSRRGLPRAAPIRSA